MISDDLYAEIIKRYPNRDVEIEVGRLRKISNFVDEENKQVSARVERVLRDKVEEHNEDNPRYRATFTHHRNVININISRVC